MKRQRILIFASVIPAIGIALFGYHYFSAAPQTQNVGHEMSENSVSITAMPASNEANDSNLESESISETVHPEQISVAAALEGEELADEPMLDEPMDISYAYGEQVPELFKERRENITTFITKDDLPIELQLRLDAALESYNQNGYLETSEAYVEHMNALYAEIVPMDLGDPKIMIEIENLDNTPLSELKYIGVVPDRVPGQEDMLIPGIRRLYEHDAGYISLYEGDLKRSEALLQKEFVNRSIKDYPATQITYCAPSNRCVTQLVWLTENKRYELSLSGDLKEFGEDNFVAIANALDLPEASIPKEAQEATAAGGQRRHEN